ncbi:MAG: alpha/beta hydrolase family protein [Cumulibacter sp.]
MTVALDPAADLPELDDAVPFEAVAREAVLGGYAWWQPHRAPTIVFAHGHGQDARFHADRARDFHNRGWHAVSVANRGWPGSTGDPNDYGLCGEIDLTAVLAVLVARGCSEIWLFGYSAGGLWMARGLSAAPQVTGAITVNSPMNIATLYRDTLARRMRTYYDEILTPDGWQVRSPVHVAHRIRTPMLAFGGTEDGMVPSSQAEEISGAVSDGTYVELSGMRHVPSDEQWRYIMERTEAWMMRVREQQ